MTTLRNRVWHAIERTPIFDFHTHLFPPEFGSLCLSGPDELLTYHYLIAETLRFTNQDPEEFLAQPKNNQANIVWKTLFVDRTPISEAAVGVASTFVALGFDLAAKDLRQARSYCTHPIEERIDWVFAQAGVEAVVMTNDPLNPDETAMYNSGFRGNSRFRTALRIDPVLFEEHGDLAWTQEYVRAWSEQLGTCYVAASLPPDLDLAGDSDVAIRLRDAVLPALEEAGLPLALMVGVRRRVNPKLDLAGDGVGKADLKGLETLLSAFPTVRFLVTTLARENSQELCVLARKFANLTPFGCWWFQNTPSLVRETTTMRLELLGNSFIPQHSDARVLEQLLYKWLHARRSISQSLVDRYAAMAEDRVFVSDAQLARDVEALMRGNALGVIR
jgi:hypothetical protein